MTDIGQSTVVIMSHRRSYTDAVEDDAENSDDDQSDAESNRLLVLVTVVRPGSDRNWHVDQGRSRRNSTHTIIHHLWLLHFSVCRELLARKLKIIVTKQLRYMNHKTFTKYHAIPCSTNYMLGRRNVSMHLLNQLHQLAKRLLHL